MNTCGSEGGAHVIRGWKLAKHESATRVVLHTEERRREIVVCSEQLANDLADIVFEAVE